MHCINDTVYKGSEQIKYPEIFSPLQCKKYELALLRSGYFFYFSLLYTYIYVHIFMYIYIYIHIFIHVFIFKIDIKQTKEENNLCSIKGWWQHELVAEHSYSCSSTFESNFTLYVAGKVLDGQVKNFSYTEK